MSRSLDDRLRAAGVAPDAVPIEAWRQLHAAEGPEATVIDLYELAARPRGLSAHDLSLDERRALARELMPDVWPGFATTSGSVRNGDLIEIVEYDPRWPMRFAHWRDAIRSELGDTARRIDHVGSTSVPGLAAKDIIDVQVSIDDIEAESAYVPHLEAIGLQLRSRDELHRYFRPFPTQPRDVHVHVCRIGSEWEAEHLLFRDFLRTDAGAREAYARAKREAPAQWADDGIAYTDAKGPVVRSILDRARSLPTA